MSLSQVPELSPEVATVPNGRQVVGRFGGISEGQYPKIRVVTGEGEGRDGQHREFYEEVEPPRTYNPTLIRELEALREGQLISLGITSRAVSFVHKTDGGGNGRAWSKGDTGLMVVDVARSCTVLDG